MNLSNSLPFPFLSFALPSPHVVFFPSFQIVLSKHTLEVANVCVQVSSIQYRKMDFEEYCAAATSVHQLEAMDTWEQHARRAYELFEKDGNRPIMIEELASVFIFCIFFFCFHILVALNF